MRTLFITEHAPYPPRGLLGARAWHRIEALRGLGPVDVFSIGDRDPDVTALPGVTSWAHVETPSARGRSHAATAPLARLLRSPGVAAEAPDHRMLSFVFQQRPDLIVLSDWLQRFPRALAGARAPIVLDLLAVPEPPHPAPIRRSGTALGRAVDGMEARRREALRRELFAAAGAVWVTEEVDRTRAYGLGAKPGTVHLVPIGIDVDAYAPARERTLPPPPGVVPGKYVLLNCGRYDDPADATAARTLLDDVLPRLRQPFPTVRLLLVGTGAHAELREAVAAAPGATLFESADLLGYLGAATAAVFNRTSAGGMPEHVMAAMAGGIPVVATSASVAGLAVRDGVHLRMREKPESIAAAVEELWMQPNVAMSLVRAAYALVCERYGLEATRAIVRGMLGIADA